MRLPFDLKRAVQSAIPPLLFLSLTAYFGWNALRGQHGLRAYAAREQMLVRARATLADAEAERDRAESQAAGLRTAHIDPDTLDERARAMLNLADPADIVVPLPQTAAHLAKGRPGG
jgi:cell division protein FtsB